jgi:hypothetical protein
MKMKLLAAVASIALVSTGVATYAQDTQRQEQPKTERMQQKPEAAPMNGQGQMNRQGQNAAQTDRRETPQQATPQQSEARPVTAAPRQADTREQNRAAPMNGQAPKAAQTERREAPRQGEARPETKAPRQADTREENRANGGNDRNKRQDAQRADRPARVTGNVRISNEHAERVGETLRRVGQPERVNFDVRVGVRVPETVSIRPLPPEVVSIVPEYRGYDYFVDANDEIVFVAPTTHEVVGTIDYQVNSASAGVMSAQGVRPCPVGND